MSDRRWIEPGDVVYDLGQQGTPKLQVRSVEAETVADYADREDFDLAEYKSHPNLPVTSSDRVLECVYIPDDPGAEPSGNNPYTLPAGRLARAPVEAADGGYSVQDEIRLEQLTTMFQRAKAIDDDPSEGGVESLEKALRLLAGEYDVSLLDEAEELADARQFARGDDS